MFVKTYRPTVANAFSVAARAATITMQVESAHLPCSSFRASHTISTVSSMHMYSQVYALPADNNAPSTNTMDREGGEPSSELDVNICCCGKNNNCFGATCCAHNSIFDINRVFGNNKKKELASIVQKMYAPASGVGCETCGRMVGAFDTFAIRFPEGRTQEERMTLIVAVLQAEFQLFEM